MLKTLEVITKIIRFVCCGCRCYGDSLRCHKLRYLLIVLLLCLLPVSKLAALEPPANIRLIDGVLHWDAVTGANEYHIYYFDAPVPSSSVLGNYLNLTGATRWPLNSVGAPYGYYTVVAVQTFGQPVPVEFSGVTDGEIVPYFSTTIPVESFSTLLVSGQDQSYLFGDDGDQQAGVLSTSERYIINGDGTFTDTLTNLIWVADSACIPSVNWVGAINYANGLSATSGSCFSLSDDSSTGDWRLANIVELMSLYNYGLSGALADVPLTNLTGPFMGSDFWSSTSFDSAPTPNDIGLAWEVKYLSDMDAGSHVDQKSNSGRAWAVRDRH